MHQALVIPVDTTQPCRTIYWQSHGELLPLLYKEIGADCIDSSPVCHFDGMRLIFWVDDTGLVIEKPQYNDHALGIARGVGYNTPALAGTVVVTGGVDPLGETESLDLRLLRYIEQAINSVRSIKTVEQA